MHPAPASVLNSSENRQDFHHSFIVMHLPIKLMICTNENNLKSTSILASGSILPSILPPRLSQPREYMEYIRSHPYHPYPNHQITRKYIYGALQAALLQPQNDQRENIYMEQRNGETVDCFSTFTQIVFRLASSSPLCAHQLKRPLSPGNDPFTVRLCIF